jgi:hypothetical protein
VASDGGSEFENMVMILLGIGLAGGLISQVPLSDDMNVWQKGKAVVSSVFNTATDDSDDNSGEDEGPADDGDGRPAGGDAAPEPADGADGADNGDSGGDSLADRLGLDLSGGHDEEPAQ